MGGGGGGGFGDSVHKLKNFPAPVFNARGSNCLQEGCPLTREWRDTSRGFEDTQRKQTGVRVLTR